MTDNSQNNKRIAKNTILLYFRMILTMAVTLYTSRVVLRVLGVDDFGLYNVVGGVVVMFSFINTAMTTATQRFLNFALGSDDLEKFSKTFSMALTGHVLIALVLFVLAETIGLWFLNTYINIPEGRVGAANWVYQFSVLVLCISIVRVPYNAVIIAHEKMSFYAYISFFDVVVKLLIVYLLLVVNFDKLITYSILIFFVNITVLGIYMYYCLHKYNETRYRYFWDPKLFKEMFAFSGWSLFGGLASTSVQQGTSIVLNMFFSVVVNTALGLANQVSMAVYSFASNFQMAFTPQLTKYYVQGEIKEMHKLIILSCKGSLYLYLIVAFPLFLVADFILKLWLGTVPDWTATFTRYMLLYMAIETLSAPLWIATQAVGKIRNYQIGVSLIMILTLPISWFLFVQGAEPSSILLVRLIVSIVLVLYRLVFLQKLIQLSVWNMIGAVLIPNLIVFGICGLMVSVLQYINFTDDLFKLGVILVVSELLLFISIYSVGISCDDRKNINVYFREKWRKIKK